MTLFFFHASNGDGESLDWFVRAPTRRVAKDLYFKWLDEEYGSEPDGPVRCWEVPNAAGKEEVLDWADMNETTVTP